MNKEYHEDRKCYAHYSLFRTLNASLESCDFGHIKIHIINTTYVVTCYC